MTPCTLTNHIVPGTCILISAYIVQERENVLKKGGVQEEVDNRRECNDVGEAIAGPSSMNIDQSSPRHISTSGVTFMMILQAMMDLEHQSINLKHYETLFLRNTACFKDSLIQHYYYECGYYNFICFSTIYLMLHYI